MATPLSNNTISTSGTSVNFHSSGLRQKVDQLMDILWSGGVNNPMDSIEQISYLLFLRLLSEKDEQLAALSKNYKRIFSGAWASRAWGNFVTLTGDQLFDAVRAAIESLHELPGLTDTGKLLFSRANLKIYDRPTLRAVIQSINNMDLNAHDGVDLKGDMYEYLLGKIAASGTNGQFRTPRHIIRMIVELVDPQPGQRICDPAVGTAGFLIAAFEYIKRLHTSPTELARGQVTGDLLTPAHWRFLEEHAFTGYDNDANMVKIAILNLYLHQLDKADIEFHNALTTNRYGTYPGALYDVILANPPFAGKIQTESILADINLNTRNTELLFLKWMIDHLEDGGRAGVIVPNGVLFASTNAARKVRELLLTTCDLQAVINLPSGVFKPYSGVGTAALIFEKGKRTGSVWFYDITADGFSLDDKRTPTPSSNDIPDLLAKWEKREEGSNSYNVSTEAIKENGWKLVAGLYKPMNIEATKHDAPHMILKDVIAVEQSIIKRAEKLTSEVGG